MTEQYRLVFKGEVREGQHRAVVRKRLAELLKLEGDRLEQLFSGKPVVVKKAIDKEGAARFVSAFRKCGAVLEAIREGSEPQPEGAAPESGVSESGVSESGLSVAPTGSDMLKEEERAAIATPEIATEHLAVVDTPTEAPAGQDTTPAPDTSHISVAETGADLNPDAEPVSPALDLDEIDFEVEETGADLGQKKKPDPPPPPDTDHLSIT